MHLQHFLSWNKANIKHSCKSQLYTFYHQTKTPISFWCRRGLNPIFVILPPKTLAVELTETHKLNPIKSSCKTFTYIMQYSILFHQPFSNSK